MGTLLNNLVDSSTILATMALTIGGATSWKMSRQFSLANACTASAAMQRINRLMWFNMVKSKILG